MYFLFSMLMKKAKHYNSHCGSLLLEAFVTVMHTSNLVAHPDLELEGGVHPKIV